MRHIFIREERRYLECNVFVGVSKKFFNKNIICLISLFSEVMILFLISDIFSVLIIGTISLIE
jgi:hypothetical protein